MNLVKKTIEKIKNREEKKLNTNYSDNNHLVLVGKVASEKRFSHEAFLHI